MQFSLLTIFYLFVRIIPIILFAYFIGQYFLTFDLNLYYFLIGLFINFAVIAALSNTKMMKNMAKHISSIKKNINEIKIGDICNTLLLAKEGPLSILPLSQAMFGYTFAYITYILIKYNLTDKNIAYFILIPIFIFMDIAWNFQNNCIDSSFIILSLLLSGSIGLLSAYIIDKFPNTDIRNFLRLNRDKEDHCIFNQTTNKFTCYGKPDFTSLDPSALVPAAAPPIAK